MTMFTTPTNFQLKTLRTTDNKSSLLHYVANVVERKFPHVLDFPDDLGFATKAARGEVDGKQQVVFINLLLELARVYLNLPVIVEISQLLLQT